MVWIENVNILSHPRADGLHFDFVGVLLNLTEVRITVAVFIRHARVSYNHILDVLPVHVQSPFPKCPFAFNLKTGLGPLQLRKCLHLSVLENWHGFLIFFLLDRLKYLWCAVHVYYSHVLTEFGVGYAIPRVAHYPQSNLSMSGVDWSVHFTCDVQIRDQHFCLFLDSRIKPTVNLLKPHIPP